MLELVEDGLMVVFVIAMVDGVMREYPSAGLLVLGVFAAIAVL